MTKATEFNAEQYAIDLIESFNNDSSINRSGGYDNGFTAIRRAKVLTKSKRTSLELGKQTSATTMKLSSIRHLEGYTVEVKQRDGRVYKGRLFFESGQAVVRSGQRVLTNFHITPKTRINTRNNRILA